MWIDGNVAKSRFFGGLVQEGPNTRPGKEEFLKPEKPKKKGGRLKKKTISQRGENNGTVTEKGFCRRRKGL